MYGRLLTFSFFLILLEKGKVCKVAIFSLLLASAKPHASSSWYCILKYQASDPNHSVDAYKRILGIEEKNQDLMY